MQNKRIAIVGWSGSGKTTLARQLAEKYQLQFVEIDQLFWQPGWTGTSTNHFRQKVKQALSGDHWVVDNYFIEIRDIVWQQADLIIWLDYSMPLCVWRTIKRTLSDYFNQAETWGGNRLSIGAFFNGNPSLLWWGWHIFKTRPRHYPSIFQAPQYAHVNVIRLRSPQATKQWLQSDRAVP